jgi:catechol 2,3-dioxygenase-like lactoylglutathione lyase family enzyme
MIAGSPVAQLRALRSVTLATPQLSEAVDFYRETWGLYLVEHDADAAWLRATGSQHHVLGLRLADRSGLVNISFAVADRREVDAAARSLERLGIPLVVEPMANKEPGGGYILRFADPEGRLLEISAETEALPAMDLSGAVPMGVTHIVLNTVDIDAAADFYVSVLGLRVSDWSEHQMVFLRCNSYHHCIAFNQGAWASVHHVAYELPSLDAFMRALGRLRHHRVVPAWGPGRHGPGNNTFVYVEDPSGMICEYTSEVQQIDETTWLPRVWKRTPEDSDLWGTAGPPSQHVRKCMAGTADPGVFATEPEIAAAMASWRNTRSAGTVR